MDIGNQKRAVQIPGFFKESGWYQQLGKFAVVGMVNTGLDWGIYLILAQWIGLAPILAKTFSYSIGVINSYILNRNWTFQSSAPFTRAFPPFLGVSLAGVLINSGCMYIALYFFNLDEIPALVIATSAAFAWNFIASRSIFFRE